jgi:hypothetical protein
MVMNEEDYTIPMRLYFNMVQYNLRTLSNLIELNESFSELVSKSIAFQTTNMIPRNENYSNVKQKMKNVGTSIENELEERDTSELTQTITTPSIDEIMFGSSSKLIANEDFSELDIFDNYFNLTDHQEQQPLEQFTDLNSDECLKLNMYGIQTIGDLNKHQISTISQKTGIDESVLNSLISHG